VATIFALAVVAASCSSSDSTFPDGSFAVVANSDIGTGPSRLLVGVIQEGGLRIGSSEDMLELEVAPADDPAAAQRVPAGFTWMVPDAFGLYRGEFEFDRPGIWQLTVHPESGDPFEPVEFGVAAETLSPNIGEAAPVAPTPTLADLPMEELTTDPDPEERFYEVSLADALASGRESVVIFATPAFCSTATCGPVLDNAKEVAADFPDVNFLHVEVYTGLTDPDFVPDAAHLAPAVTQEYWSLPSEPWVFVISEDGIVTARYEGVMETEELAGQLG
jgi:hypothetical protein